VCVCACMDVAASTQGHRRGEGGDTWRDNLVQASGAIKQIMWRCKMQTLKLLIGEVVAMDAGQQDLTTPVEFVGEEIAKRTEYGYDDRRGGPTNTRGVTETLYKTDDGRLVVHVENWSRWQGEPNHYSLVEVAEDDLTVGGRFEALGRKAGMGRSLTLAEALALWEDG
jgi:hypothetical protein